MAFTIVSLISPHRLILNQETKQFKDSVGDAYDITLVAEPCAHLRKPCALIIEHCAYLLEHCAHYKRSLAPQHKHECIGLD